MWLTTKLREVGGVAILDLEGRLVFGRDGDTLRDALLRIFEDGHRRILLNLAGLTHADSAGTGELVSAYVAIVRRGGALKLVNPQKRIRTMLAMTRLDEMMEICDTEQAGIAALQVPPAAAAQ